MESVDYDLDGRMPMRQKDAKCLVAGSVTVTDFEGTMVNHASAGGSTNGGLMDKVVGVAIRT